VLKIAENAQGLPDSIGKPGEAFVRWPCAVLGVMAGAVADMLL
jgi:hypothetical protein